MWLFEVYEDVFGTLDFSGEYSGLYSISALARATGIKIDVYYPAENGMYIFLVSLPLLSNGVLFVNYWNNLNIL